MGTVGIAVGIVALLIGAVLPTAPASSSNGGSGLPNTVLWGVVSSGGTLTRASGANSSSHVSTGVYDVYFDQYLYGCTFSASDGTTSTGTEPAGTATVVALSTSPYGVMVSTYNGSNKMLEDHDFHVIAQCPGGLSAEVAANGTFESGAGVASTGIFSTGKYFVIFSQNVVSCGYQVGLQDPTAGTATSASLAINSDGVWVSTYDMQAMDANESFHLTVYC